MAVTTAELKNFPQWENEINKFINVVEYPAIKEAFNIIVVHFRKAEKILFNTEGGAGKHGKWPPLTDKYRKWKEIHFPGKGIMVKSEALKESLTGGEGGIFTISKSGNNWKMVLGSDVRSYDGFDYPLHHQKKAKKLRRTLDPRNQLLDEFARIFQRQIMKEAKKFRTAFDVAKITNPAVWDKKQ